MEDGQGQRIPREFCSDFCRSCLTKTFLSKVQSLQYEQKGVSIILYIYGQEKKKEERINKFGISISISMKLFVCRIKKTPAVSYTKLFIGVFIHIMPLYPLRSWELRIENWECKKGPVSKWALTSRQIWSLRVK